MGQLHLIMGEQESVITVCVCNVCLWDSNPVSSYEIPIYLVHAFESVIVQRCVHVRIFMYVHMYMHTCLYSHTLDIHIVWDPGSAAMREQTWQWLAGRMVDYQ